ncbi:MAG: MCP four helix bundle domain-containing protein [Deltaproteobacteria bacterium]|nr:MCP four helix bundle domain-containing protein [Deltaproteobacteria bacterium]
MQFPKDKDQSAILWGIGIAVGLLLFAVISKYYISPVHLENTYKNLMKKSEIVSQIRINLHKSVEMEKNAVMAITDKESQEFADQSLAASAAVEQNLTRLRSLIDAVPLKDEKKLDSEFNTCWTELRKLDQVILELAVQNTNLKAASLSREKGAETMRQFEHALEELMHSYAGTPNEGRITSLSFHAITAGLKMYNLHSSHIAEASDEKMDQIETQIKAEENEVAKSLDGLAEIVGEESENLLLQAKMDFSEFNEVTAKVIKLSRQNSNIKSLELSLGRKRKIAAQCDEILTTFQETVQKNSTSRATR